MASNFYHDGTPADVKNAKGLHLITQSTSNGKKVQIFLEELKETYGTEYTKTLLNISTNEQKKDWFLRLNPNGRIPVIIDNTKTPPFPVMETSAELLYLLKEFDKNDAFGFKDEFERNQCLQWLFFWHGSAQPIQGQLNWFSKNAKDDQLALNRFKNETLRVYDVLEIQLSGRHTGQTREYLAGNGKGRYSVADMGAWPWVNNWKASGQITEEDFAKFPHLKNWVERIGQRPAVQKGIDAKTWQV